MIESPTTREGARNVCDAWGSYVVTIASSDENSTVASLAATGGVNRNVWLGLSIAACGPPVTFDWVETGEPVIYENWAPGEPDNCPSYTAGYLDSSTGLWYDDNWSVVTHPFICEHEW